MKRILLVDENDARRATRVLLLQRAGYQVAVADSQSVQGALPAAEYDLVILETDHIKDAVIAYGNRLKEVAPKLPILLLSDQGIFLPRESLLAHFRIGSPSPTEVIAKIAGLLLASSPNR